MTSDRVVVEAKALARLVRAAVAHQARSRVSDPELRDAIAALLTSSSPAPPERTYVGIDEAAALLSVSPRTIRRRMKDGSLPARRLGRRVLVPLEAIEGQGRPGADTPVVDVGVDGRSSLT